MFRLGPTGLAGWDEIDRDAAELRERLVPELGEDYTPSKEQFVRLQEFGRAVRSAWGSGAAPTGLLPSVRSLRQLGMLERMSASPGMARATVEALFRIGRAADPADDHRANSGHPCARGPSVM